MPSIQKCDVSRSCIFCAVLQNRRCVVWSLNSRHQKVECGFWAANFDCCSFVSLVFPGVSVSNLFSAFANHLTKYYENLTNMLLYAISNRPSRTCMCVGCIVPRRKKMRHCKCNGISCIITKHILSVILSLCVCVYSLGKFVCTRCTYVRIWIRHFNTYTQFRNKFRVCVCFYQPFMPYDERARWAHNETMMIIITIIFRGKPYRGECTESNTSTLYCAVYERNEFNPNRTELKWSEQSRAKQNRTDASTTGIS